MALIDMIEASKSFANKIVLKNVNFSANDGEKIAVIGKNGEGKSTFLKALMGELNLDSGRIIRQNNKTIAMLSQAVNFNLNLTVKELIKKELDEIYTHIKEYENLQILLANNSENKEFLKRLDELVNFIESKDAWDIDSKIKRILKEFELLNYEDRAICTLSGGEIRRVGLCILLLKNPDILLLDEPTNHLDVYMTSFLEDMLKKSKMCVIFISHDRYFIDSIAHKCVELESGELRIFNGAYANYLKKKSELLQSLSKSYETLLKQLKSEEEWLRKGVKARLKRNEGRKERILKMREEAKKNPSLIKKLKLEIQRANSSASQTIDTNRKKMLFELKNISKTLNNKVLFKNFSARILQGEKIAIVGRNGCGKSSFLKVILGHLSSDSGEIKMGDLKIGYFDQARELLNSDKSLIEIFCPNGGDRVRINDKDMHVYGYLKNFLFPKEFLEQKVSILSGGEKNRVALALLFTKQYDVLILDEPTNDLDIATINILEEHLLKFQGAILLVSHDRYFVDKIANKLFVFENSLINVEHISYTQYLEKESELKNFDLFANSLTDKKELNVKQKDKQKLSYKENEILNTYPQKIQECEQRIEELHKSLCDEKIYKELGINFIYEELKSKEEELKLLEKKYFEVLEKTLS